MQFFGISESGEAQQAGRLVFVNVFPVDKESQETCVREPAGGVTRMYLSHFGVPLKPRI